MKKRYDIIAYLVIAFMLFTIGYVGCSGKASTAARGTLKVIRNIDDPLDLVDWVLEQAEAEDEEEGGDDDKDDSEE